MTIYILSVPHQMPPFAYEWDTENDALAYFEQRYERSFDNVHEAASHDMHAGYLADSIEGLRDAASGLRHQYFKAMAAIDNL